MSDKYSPDIAAWLSEVSSDTSPESDSEVTPTRISRKRKRLGNQLDQSITKRPLREVLPNRMNSPAASPQKQGTKKSQTIVTPQTDTTKSSYKARSRPATSTSSFGAKQTPNEDNVRAALAKQGMFFEDEESYQKYPDFKAYIETMVLGARCSARRTDSLVKIKHWRIENATKDEKTYFARAVPLILKDQRGAAVTLKRTFEGEIVSQAKTFESDDLDSREDCAFVKHILPLRVQKAEVQLGLTNPQPDWVFGLKRPRFPDAEMPVLSNETSALIEVAPGLKHAFFTVDNKGSQHSIEAAENQSIRSGAALVAARRTLNRKAKGIPEPAEPEELAAATDGARDGARNDAGDAAEDAARDVTTADDAPTTGPNTPAPLQVNSDKEDIGADTSSFAFTCSWVPQMANLHVHWCEVRGNRTHVYHMNLLRGYLMSDPEHLAAFRKDLHNILDWGVSAERKSLLRVVEREIEMWEGRAG